MTGAMRFKPGFESFWTRDQLYEIQHTESAAETCARPRLAAHDSGRMRSRLAACAE